MAAASIQRPSTPTATGTQTQLTNRSSLLRRSPLVGTLILRGEPRSPRQRLRWADDVVDNEGLGRKSSKVCCIYHKPKPAGESSDESSSSSSDSDSDSEPDNSTARMARRRRQQRRNHSHDHEDGDECGDGAGPSEEGTRRRRQQRRPSPNAYERIPTVRKKKGGNGTVTQVVQNP